MHQGLLFVSCTGLLLAAPWRHNPGLTRWSVHLAAVAFVAVMVASLVDVAPHPLLYQREAHVHQGNCVWGGATVLVAADSVMLPLAQGLAPVMLDIVEGAL